MGAQLQMFTPSPQVTPPPTMGGGVQRSLPGMEHWSTPQTAPTPHVEQMKMFMTAREIKDRYQALDGDRQETTRQVYGDMTPGRSSGKHYGWGTYTGSSNPDAFGHQFYQRSRTGTSTVQFDIETAETDEELWERKSNEAHMTPNEYSWERGSIAPSRYVNTAGNTTARPGTDTHVGRATWHEQNYTGSGTPDTSQRIGWKEYEQHEEGGRSLADKLLDQGVKAPISLGTGGPSGMMGKPQIVGGHHRVAAMGERSPDTLMPVLHFTNIHEARGYRGPGGGNIPMPWKYT